MRMKFILHPVLPKVFSFSLKVSEYYAGTKEPAICGQVCPEYKTQFLRLFSWRV
jgi:hypothetical protein